jgi:hypothetical protein
VAQSGFINPIPDWLERYVSSNTFG